jgi:hypothetical protein
MLVINVMCIDLKNGIVEDVHGFLFLSIHTMSEIAVTNAKKQTKKPDSNAKAIKHGWQEEGQLKM